MMCLHMVTTSNDSSSTTRTISMANDFCRSSMEISLVHLLPHPQTQDIMK